MRKNLDHIDPFRVKLMGFAGDSHNGAARIKIKGDPLNIIFSNQGGWDHVSVSHKTRCPTWDEMCAIKALFFKDTEWVVQYHPAETQYVNTHPYCLHLWRCQDAPFPTPPQEMV